MERTASTSAISRLEAKIFPALGNRPIEQFELPELLAVT